MSFRLRLLNRALKLFEKPHLARAEPFRLRRSFERKARLFFRPPRGSRFREDLLADAGRAIPALWALGRDVQGDPAKGMILYFHGGGFVFGSPRTHRAMLARLSGLAGLPACLPRYRLAPEHPFPAAFEDAVAAYRSILDRGVPANRIFLGGDSAGGGLAFSLLAAIRANGLPMPAAVFAFSPMLDFTFSGASFRENAARDVVLPASRAREMRALYLRDASPEDPRASPLFTDFPGACPAWLAVGDTEILLDDSRRMAQKLRAGGVDTALTIAHDHPHVWPMFHDFLPEAGATLGELAQWIRQRAGKRGDS